MGDCQTYELDLEIEKKAMFVLLPGQLHGCVMKSLGDELDWKGPFIS